MKLSENQKLILINIKAKMVRGDVRAISNSLNKSEAYISQVLNPEKNMYNEAIVDAATALIMDRERKERRTLEKVNQ